MKFFCLFLALPPSRFLSHSQCICWHLNIQKSLSSNSPKIYFTLFPKFSKLTMIQILFRWKSIMCYCSKHIKKHNPPSNTCISNKHCLDHQCFTRMIKNKVSYWINMVTMYWQNYYTKIPQLGFSRSFISKQITLTIYFTYSCMYLICKIFKKKADFYQNSLPIMTFCWALTHHVMEKEL